MKKKKKPLVKFTLITNAFGIILRQEEGHSRKQNQIVRWERSKNQAASHVEVTCITDAYFPFKL